MLLVWDSLFPYGTGTVDEHGSSSRNYVKWDAKSKINGQAAGSFGITGNASTSNNAPGNVQAKIEWNTESVADATVQVDGNVTASDGSFDWGTTALATVKMTGADAAAAQSSLGLTASVRKQKSTLGSGSTAIAWDVQDQSAMTVSTSGAWCSRAYTRLMNPVAWR